MFDNLTEAHYSYIAHLIREDLGRGVMLWEHKGCEPLSREAIRRFANSIDPDGSDEKMHDLPIDHLQLPLRAYNALYRAGITKVGQLEGITDARLRQIPNMGNKGSAQVLEALETLRAEMR